MVHRRRLAWTALGLAMVMTGAETAGAAPGNDLEPGPRPDYWVTDGPVNAVVQHNGIVYVGGLFSHLRPNRGTGIAFDMFFQQADPAFPQADGAVYSVVSDGSGGFYVGGDFTALGGYPRNNLAHIRPDRSVNPNWNPGADGAVTVLAKSGRKVFAAGNFTMIGTRSRNYLAALDAVTGQALDWNPQVEEAKDIATLAIYRETVLVGGSFSQIGGQLRNGLAALSMESGLATSWNPGPSGGEVLALAVVADTVYAGGTFTAIGPRGHATAAAVDAITGAILNWNPLPLTAAGGPGKVEAIAVVGPTVYLGGQFSSLNGGERNGLGAVDAVTGLATSWNPALQPAAGARVTALAASESRVYAAGSFSVLLGLQSLENFVGLDPASGSALNWNLEFTGPIHDVAISYRTVYAAGPVLSTDQVARENLAALDAATGMPTEWNPSVGGEVHALLVAHDRLYVGGAFLGLGGLAARNIAAVDLPTGEGRTDWIRDANGPVYALASGGDTVYVGGDFDRIDIQARRRLAAVKDSGQVTGWKPSAGAAVRTIAAGENLIYVGGDFTDIDGDTAMRLTAIDLDGLPTGWNPAANGIVQALAVSGDTLYVGGRFTELTGESRNRIAAFNTATSELEAWNPDADRPILGLAVGPGLVYVGGEFTSVGGSARHRLAALAMDTGMSADWDPDCDGTVRALAFTAAPAGTASVPYPPLLAGGEFDRLSGRLHPNFGAFPPVGSPRILAWPSHQMGLPGTPVLLRVEAAGVDPLAYQWFFNGVPLAGQTGPELVLDSLDIDDGGAYAVRVDNSLGSVQSDPAMVTVLQAPVIALQPTDQTLEVGETLTLRVVALGIPLPTYHWRRNGLEIPGAIGPVLSVSNVTHAVGGSYSVWVSNPGGLVQSRVAQVKVSAAAGNFVDDLDRISLMSQSQWILSGNNREASKEAGEPDHAGNPGGRSLWIGWLAEADGVATLGTGGSGFDTLLAVYTKEAAGGLALVEASDDGGSFGASRLMFNAREGVEYLMAVDGYNGVSGDFILDFALDIGAAPIPVLLARPQSLVVPAGTDAMFSVSATSPTPLRYQWYLGPNRLPGETNPVLMVPNVELGKVGRYFVELDNGSSLSVQRVPAVLEIGPGYIPLPHDWWGDKEWMQKMGSVSFGGVNAAVAFGFALQNLAPSLPNIAPCDSVVSDGIWITNLTVMEPGSITIDTAGSTFQTVLSVVQGIPPFHQEIDCDDQSSLNGFDSVVKFFPTPNVEYNIFLAGLNGATGTVQLNITYCATPQVNTLPSSSLTPFVDLGSQQIFNVEVPNQLCPVTYQWLKNNVPIPNSDSPSLTHNGPLLPGDKFAVTVSNCAGSVTVLVAAFVQLWIDRLTSPDPHPFRLKTIPPTMDVEFEVRSAEADFQWSSFHTNPANTPLDLPLDTVNPMFPRRFFRIWPPVMLVPGP